MSRLTYRLLAAITFFLALTVPTPADSRGIRSAELGMDPPPVGSLSEKVGFKMYEDEGDDDVDVLDDAERMEDGEDFGDEFGDEDADDDDHGEAVHVLREQATAPPPSMADFLNARVF